MCIRLMVEEQTSIPFPELPFNITHGLCFYPHPQLPVKLLAQFAYAQGNSDERTVHPEAFCDPNLHRLALIPTANFSPACLSACAVQGLWRENKAWLFSLLTLPSEVPEVYSSYCFFTASGFFQRARDSCSCPPSCEPFLKIFCGIVF